MGLGVYQFGSLTGQCEKYYHRKHPRHWSTQEGMPSLTLEWSGVRKLAIPSRGNSMAEGPGARGSIA